MGQPLSTNLDWKLANPQWAQALNPMLANPFNNVQIITDIQLISGVTIIPHKLGKQMEGWFQVDITAGVSYYRSAPFNNKTLQLTSSGIAVLAIGVF